MGGSWMSWRTKPSESYGTPPLLLQRIKAFLSFPFALFSREDLGQEEKAKFGEYCSSENGKGREWFARYVSAQVRGVTPGCGVGQATRSGEGS
ncbi:hypothetical protein E2I00_019407 [Balaenoptera physalus]|uniref:Uncharacterized protein n=1 Tax=Balaenoptera physalus TaxID=9770 RepID=A0A643BXD0_BALPH|nr:hypothetical protein E2I00_019407 [Balaenoptera physalus]